MEVTAVLANSPGGLELLPTKAYGNGWLQAQSSGGLILNLPMNGDPYEEIYKAQGKWFSLLNPAWINIAGSNTSGKDQTFKILDRAKEFHEMINDYYHDNSYAIYGADNNRNTWGNVIWNFDARINANQLAGMVLSNDNGTGQLTFACAPRANNIDTKTRVDIPDAIHASLKSAVDAGDGTVPIRSTDTQIPKCLVVFRQTGYEHQTSYQDSNSIYATLYSIIKIIKQMKRNST